MGFKRHNSLSLGGLDDDYDARPADPTDKERIDVAVERMLAGEPSPGAFVASLPKR